MKTHCGILVENDTVINDIVYTSESKLLIENKLGDIIGELEGVLFDSFVVAEITEDSIHEIFHYIKNSNILPGIIGAISTSSGILCFNDNFAKLSLSNTDMDNSIKYDIKIIKYN